MIPKVSIIMSCYNSERYLAECLDSLINQTFSAMEILITNDGSSDRTGEILAHYQGVDDRISVFNNESNLGLTKNLNAMIKKCRGEFIARMDSDDICRSDRIEKQHDFLSSNKHIGVVGTNCSIIDEHGISKGERKMPESNDAIVRKLIFFNCLNHPTIMIRSSILKNNLYDESFRTSQDWELWLRLSKMNVEMYNIQEPLLEYRVETDYLRKRKTSYRMNELSIKRKYLNDYPFHIWLMSCLPTLALIITPNVLFPVLKKLDPRK